MADLSPVYPNEPFRLLDADVTNVLLAMAREWQSRNRGGSGGYLPSVPQGDPVSVVMQNRTGSDLDQYAIVGISDALVPYATDSTEFKRRPQFRATTPSATAPFAVLQHPLKNWVSDSTPNTIGRAVISGCTVCKLNIGDSSHTYAAPTTSTTELTTGTSGPARILAKESGTGEGKWGVVLLNGGNSAGISDAEVIDLDYVAKVCVTRRSGVVTNVTAEHRTIRVLGKVLTDETYCTTGDEDCCPIPACGGCEGSYWPQELNLHVECSGVEGVSFDVTLTYAVSSIADPLCAAGWFGMHTTESGICQYFWFGCVGDFPVPALRNGCLAACDTGDELNFASEYTCDPINAQGTSELLTSPNCLAKCGDAGYCFEFSWTVTPASSPPPSGTCCDDATDFLGVLNCDGDDFETFGGGDFWDYDPSIHSAAVGDPRAQWRTSIYNGPTEYWVYFGCDDEGQRWLIVPLPLGGCFSAMPGYEEFDGFYAIIPVAGESCDGSIVIDATVTGSGTGCDGYLRFTIYR